MKQPEVEVCAHAGCAEPATVALRFGDGTTRQSPVAYCDEHAAIVRRLFWTFDERELGVEDSVERAAQP